MTRQSVHDGAKAWGIHGDLTDGTAPRMFEDATVGLGLAFSVPTLARVQVAGALTAAATDIDYDTPTGSALTASGTAYIDTGGVIEQFTYTGKSATQLTGCTRGTGGTTAAAHNDNDGITQSPPLPADHTKWIKHAPAAAALFRYDGDSTVLPIACTGGMFAAVVRYLWFSGTPTASVNRFLSVTGLASGSAAQFGRQLQLRTDLKVNMTLNALGGANVADTSVETLPTNTRISVVITVETDAGGFIKYRVYYSTDDGATFTQLTWNTPGTASAVDATTLTVIPNDVWSTNQHAGRTVTMGGSTGTILSNTATVLTLTAAGWDAGTPVAGTFTMSALDHHKGDGGSDIVPTVYAGSLQAFSFAWGTPTADPANDNGISTYFSEIGVIHSSEYLGAYPTGFAVGKFAPNADSADAAYLEWNPNSGTTHYLMVNVEVPGIFFLNETVAGSQEMLEYEASTTTKIPAANTPIVLKSWANLRSSSSLPDATNLAHLVKDNGAYYSYPSHDTAASGLPKSSVSLRQMPGGGGRWTTARIDAVLAGLDKVGDDTLLYRARQMWITVISISNPASIATLPPPRDRMMRRKGLSSVTRGERRKVMLCPSNPTPYSVYAGTYSIPTMMRRCRRSRAPTRERRSAGRMRCGGRGRRPKRNATPSTAHANAAAPSRSPRYCRTG